MKATFYDLCLDILIYMTEAQPARPSAFAETTDFSRQDIQNCGLECGR